MSEIKRDVVESSQGGEVAKCKWFIPNTIDLDAQMLDDMGEKFWCNQVSCRHLNKLPGGTLVEIRAIYRKPGGRAPEMLVSFMESVDFVLGKWEPENPFTSYEPLSSQVYQQWGRNFPL